MHKNKRHKFLYNVLRFLLTPILKKLFHYDCQTITGLHPPYLVLANHNLNLDPALLAISFPQHMYFVASEHIYRWGLASKLIAWAFAPVARTKGSTDARTVKQILRHLRNGCNIGLFAEGNRSFNGLTGPIFPSTGKLIKAAGVTVVTFRFEGGYFTNPRWGATIRRGKMRGYAVQTYTPDQIQQMSAAEVQAAITCDLYEDAYARQKEAPVAFKGKHLAKGLENVLYMCPRCKGIGTLRGVDDTFLCGCGLTARYTEYGELAGELPFHTITQWDAWQTENLASLVQDTGGALTISDEAQQLFSVDSGKGTTLLETGALCMDEKAFSCGRIIIPIMEISDMAIYADKNLVFTTTNGKHYEVRPPGATKYLEYFHILQKAR